MKQISKRLMNWASILEDNTREQAERTATMPFIHPHVALMPDAHLGKGATVGSVIPSVGAIIPAAVGVDIGCGMMAVRTQFTRADLEARYGDDLPRALAALHADISGWIPLSAGGYNTELTESAADRVAELRRWDGVAQAQTVAPNWPLQLGSLGSGNHFIEVSLDELDRVWLFLHSGSRGVGNKLAQKHIKVAQAEMDRWFINLPDPDLAYLVEGTPEFWHYMEALRWAQHFAFRNREEMMDRVAATFADFMGVHPDPLVREETINCHHNYTEREQHFGREVWLSRKGAISAKAGELGLIPGSMGDKSYVVVGKGNKLALESSPHGAGRSHSRRKAKETFTRADLNERMAAAGVVWGNSDAFIDEHPLAYKPIDVVMDDAVGLVEIRHTLRQIINVKGD